MHWIFILLACILISLIAVPLGVIIYNDIENNKRRKKAKDSRGNRKY